MSTDATSKYVAVPASSKASPIATSSTSTNIISGGQKKRNNQTKEKAKEGAYHDPHPTVVPKKSSQMSRALKKSSVGLTWGEEAEKLSNMVRSKYSAGGPGAKAQDVNQNQLKLLYMIHQYSYASTDRPNDECWIRRIPVLVLLYEGIVSQVFDYDYAPSLEVFQANRVYLNITQEGKDDIDDLREKGLIEALTLASSEYDQCLAYTTKRTH